MSYRTALPCCVRAGIEKGHASTWPHVALCSIASPKGSTPVSLGRIRLSVTADHIGPALRLLKVLWAWKMCVSMEKRSWDANRYACVTIGAKSEEEPAETGRGRAAGSPLRGSAKTDLANKATEPESHPTPPRVNERLWGATACAVFAVGPSRPTPAFPVWRVRGQSAHGARLRRATRPTARRRRC